MDKKSIDDRLDRITLAYISAKYNVSEMDVTEYWELFKKTFNQFSELYHYGN